MDENGDFMEYPREKKIYIAVYTGPQKDRRVIDHYFYSNSTFLAFSGLQEWNVIDANRTGLLAAF